MVRGNTPCPGCFEEQQFSKIWEDPWELARKVEEQETLSSKKNAMKLFFLFPPLPFFFHTQSYVEAQFWPSKVGQFAKLG